MGIFGRRKSDKGLDEKWLDDFVHSLRSPLPLRVSGTFQTLPAFRTNLELRRHFPGSENQLWQYACKQLGDTSQGLLDVIPQMLDIDNSMDAFLTRLEILPDPAFNLSLAMEMMSGGLLAQFEYSSQIERPGYVHPEVVRALCDSQTVHGYGLEKYEYQALAKAREYGYRILAAYESTSGPELASTLDPLSKHYVLKNDWYFNFAKRYHTVFGTLPSVKSKQQPSPPATIETAKVTVPSSAVTFRDLKVANHVTVGRITIDGEIVNSDRCWLTLWSNGEIDFFPRISTSLQATLDASTMSDMTSLTHKHKIAKCRLLQQNKLSLETTHNEVIEVMLNPKSEVNLKRAADFRKAVTK
jgi:hypothetical protein